MLVRGLGEALLRRLLSDSFLVRNDGVTLLDWALGVLFLKILKADLNVELTATGNNVFTTTDWPKPESIAFSRCLFDHEM